MLGVDFSSLPNYAYVLFGLVIALMIYALMPEDAKKPIKIFLKNRGVPILIILLWVCMRDQMGTFPIDSWWNEQANTFGVLLLTLYALGVNFLGKERYDSTQAIADDKSGSCMDYKIVGDYVVLNIGSVKGSVFSWVYGHESWIVPKRLFKKIDKKNYSKSQILCLVKIAKADILEIPVKCYEFLEASKTYNKDNIFYGELSQEELEYEFDIQKEKDKNPIMKKLLADLEMEIRDKNRMLSETRDMLKGKTSAIKGFVSDANGIQNTASGGYFRPKREGD